MDSRLIILGIVVLVGVGLFFFGQFKFTQVEGCQFVIQPQFGRIECEPISSTEIAKYEIGWSGDIRSNPAIAKCGDNENTNLCDFTVRMDGTGSVVLFYQVDGSSSCPVGEKEYCTVNIKRGDETIIRTKEKLGTRFAVGGACESNVFGSCALFGAWISGNIYSWYIPYGLNVYDSGQKLRYNTQSCDLASLGYADKDDVCLQSDGSACVKTKTSSRLDFDDWVNYLSTFTYAPIDVSNKIVTYNGQLAYCQINSIYSLSEFKTDTSAGGSCYKYPKERIALVDCCPSMETANSRCGDDFKWHAILIGECDANRPCQTGYDCVSNKCQLRATCFSDVQCTGQGQFYVDYSKDKTVSRQSCVDGQCKIVESKTVQCTPPYNGCPSGQVCNPNKGYICEGQTGPEIVCGDGVCSAPYENTINCSKDCKVPPPLEIPYLLYIIMISLGALLGYVIKKRDVVWAGIGAIIGLVIALILDFVLRNWLILLVGGIIGGSLVIYFAGGTILMIIMAIIAAKK